MPVKVNLYRVELYHVAVGGLAAPYWKVLRDVLKKDRAILYADESARYFKASARVIFVQDQTQKVIYNVNHEHPAMLYFETLEGRAKDILFVEYLENNEQIDDLPFLRAFPFQNMLDTPDGKVALYDLSVKLRKQLH